jgi:hypothetical protein
VLGYALFALTLPRGHLLQNYLAGTSGIVVGGADELQPSPTSVAQAVNEFTHPPITIKRAVARSTAPAPSRTTLTVLNGNGIPGAAAMAAQLLAQRHYVLQRPPGGRAANAPTMSYSRAKIYFDPARAGAQAAAGALQHLLTGADVQALPSSTALRALDPGSMLLVLLGKNFDGSVGPSPIRIPAANAPTASTLTAIRHDTTAGRSLLEPLQHHIPFPLETPTVLESSSSPDTLAGDEPARLYKIVPGHMAVRLVFRTAGGAFWGIEETDWPNPPAFSNRGAQRTINGRSFQLSYAGPHLHMVVLKQGHASYWVINTLLDTLSNQTMLEIAEGLRPLRPSQK